MVFWKSVTNLALNIPGTTQKKKYNQWYDTQYLQVKSKICHEKKHSNIWPMSPHEQGIYNIVQKVTESMSTINLTL